MASWLPFKKDNGSFDSRIDPPSDSANFSLTLILRIFLRPVNPPKGSRQSRIPDADGILVPINRWTHAAWIKFRTEFRYQAYSTWDLAYLLTPPAKYDGFVWPERGGTRRRIICKIDLRVVDHEDDVHASINVAHLANPGPHLFRSDDFNFDSGDILPTPLHGYDGVSWTHHTLPHEVGHLLGLGHVNQRSVECRQNPGTSICYGANLQQSLNVMGRGDMLDLSNAQPWVERIAFVHTKTRPEDWQVNWASDDASLRGTENIDISQVGKAPAKP